MSATRRRNIADEMDAIDGQIWDLQQAKKDAYGSYREALKKDGLRDHDIKLEVEALKKAIARRRKLIEKPGEVEETDAKVDEIVADLMTKPKLGTRLATHARPARAETPHDPTTGEVLGDAPAPAPDSLGPLRTQEEQPSPSEPRSLTVGSPQYFSPAACANPAAAQEANGQSGMTATTPYRVTDPAPVPAAPDPDVSPLIADAAARQAAARRLLGQAEAAE